MTQETSSLMDGELSPAEARQAIRACCASPSELDNWHLYHVIGDAMRGQVPRDLAYSKAIRAALEQEPAVIARPKRVLESTFARVSLAAAASVATIGVVGWIGSQGGAPGGSGAVVAGAAKSAIQPVAATAPVANTVVIDQRPYLDAHRQMPRPEAYQTVNGKALAPAR